MKAKKNNSKTKPEEKVITGKAKDEALPLGSSRKPTTRDNSKRWWRDSR